MRWKSSYEARRFFEKALDLRIPERDWDREEITDVVGYLENKGEDWRPSNTNEKMVLTLEDEAGDEDH